MPASQQTTFSSTSNASWTTPSLRRRMACWLYEGVLLFGVVFLAGYLFSTLSQSRHALENRTALQWFLFIVLGIYFVWFWAHGQTLAMKTWNIRVVDRHGQALSQTRALVRYVLSWVWFMPALVVDWMMGLSSLQSLVLVLGWIAIWAILSRFHPQGQFWHDAWAGSRLVHSQPLSRLT
ncbi:RDD family protein [Curvibacter sp. CHRR-16]|uniref:RDD family protein n=1 Tax=Curvibacter sp. CHRR-16 TaxID=2835872 RepID=UPI001BDA63AC|nr:RDD family protein [Curvibacter sp. CHRR-16]MBT0568776.1 RDD family protein [Curvibacter sp. CHRR-16]